MKNILTLSLLAITGLSLSACVDRAQADERLKRGCAAGVELFIPEGFTLKEIKNASYSKPRSGEGDRKVTLTVVESDGWYDGEKTYSCNFVESFGFLKMSHDANIYQIDMGNGQIHGKKDGKIVSGFDEWLKITETIDNAMN
ncbi:MAG: hypothetical protein ACLFR0_02325 [Alphaproteobacteria bacterium]